MTFGSLFAGIGGFDLGLERAGMECKWQVEIDDYCLKVLAKHWPDVPKYGDVTKLTGKELERVDLVCGGFPCQPVSLAGKRKGDKDERWLWDEMYRICKVVRPSWILGENVPGLLSAESGWLFGQILRDLAEGGHDVLWDNFPAGILGAHFLGSRVFIFASRSSASIRRLQGCWPTSMEKNTWRQHEFERLVRL